jgi:hypothetical protein
MDIIYLDDSDTLRERARMCTIVLLFERGQLCRKLCTISVTARRHLMGSVARKKFVSERTALTSGEL